MRLSKWVLAVSFSLSLVAVAGWVTLAQDDGEPTLTAGDATNDETTSSSDGARGAADGEPRIAAGDVEPGNDTVNLGVLRGIRGEPGSGTTIDLGPLGDLLDFGLEDVTSDVEVRTDVLDLDTVLRESDLLSDLGDDEILRVDRADAAARDLARADLVHGNAARNPIDQLDPVNLDGVLVDRQPVDLGMVSSDERTVDVTGDVILDDVLDDLDDIRLLDDRHANDLLDRVNLDDLYAGAVIGDVAVVELDEPLTASRTDDVLANLDPRDVGNLDTLVARDDLGRPGGLDLLDNLAELDRMENVDVLGRLDGRALPNDLALLDLDVLTELDTARSDPLADLELLGLFDLEVLGLRDGLGLGPP